MTSVFVETEFSGQCYPSNGIDQQTAWKEISSMTLMIFPICSDLVLIIGDLDANCVLALALVFPIFR